MIELKEKPVAPTMDNQINSQNYITRQEFENVINQLKENVNKTKRQHMGCETILCKPQYVIRG